MPSPGLNSGGKKYLPGGRVLFDNIALVWQLGIEMMLRYNQDFDIVFVRALRQSEKHINLSAFSTPLHAYDILQIIRDVGTYLRKVGFIFIRE